MYIHDEITIKETPLGVPYARSERDQMSHDYVNLREQPDFVALLPELRDAPSLRSLVEALNSTNGPFETYGCEKWSQPWSHEQFPGFNMRFGSYVDFAFVEKRQCQTQNIYHQLVNSFRQRVESGERLSDAMQAYFELTHRNPPPQRLR